MKETDGAFAGKSCESAIHSFDSFDIISIFIR
jgi:hypothetical protein